MEQEKSEKKPDNVEASSSKPSSSVKQTPKILKPRPKIVKKSPTSVNTPPKIVKTPPVKKTNEAISTSRVQGGTTKKNMKKTSTPQGNKESNNNGTKEEEKPNMKKDKEKMKVTEPKPIINDQNDQKNDKNFGTTEKGRPNQKNKEKHGGSDKNQKPRKNKNVLDKNLRQRHQENGRKKDEIAGLIFMCNTSTKPDCFRYRVMGVPMGKKDLVLGVKPGIRLFLYDFDLKLMYGIYKATSSGGMKLEPEAFGGAFPVQVRFDVHQDCYPLPESAFKSAIKENYDKRHKFKTELTLPQVRRLVDLFRPAEGQSNGQHIESPVPRSVRYKEVNEDQRDSRHFPSRNDDSRRYGSRPYDMEDRVSHRPGSSRRDEPPLDSFLSEQEYRTYSLQGLRRDRLTPPHLVSTLEPNRSSRESEHHLRHLAYRETVPTNELPPPLYRETSLPTERLREHPPTHYRETIHQIEPIRHDPFFMSEKEYQTFGLRREVQPQIAASTATTGSDLYSYLKNPYYSRNYGASASYADPYLQPPVRRDEVFSSSYLIDHHRRTASDHSLRVAEDQMGMAYPAYATGAVPDYNQGRVQLQDTNPEATFAPVSSRYSFAGPPSTYR